MPWGRNPFSNQKLLYQIFTNICHFSNQQRDSYTVKVHFTKVAEGLNSTVCNLKMPWAGLVFTLVCPNAIQVEQIYSIWLSYPAICCYSKPSAIPSKDTCLFQYFYFPSWPWPFFSFVYSLDNHPHVQQQQNNHCYWHHLLRIQAWDWSVHLYLKE